MLNALYNCPYTAMTFEHTQNTIMDSLAFKHNYPKAPDYQEKIDEV